jgi:hypothetical protein
MDETTIMSLRLQGSLSPEGTRLNMVVVSAGAKKELERFYDPPCLPSVGDTLLMEGLGKAAEVRRVSYRVPEEGPWVVVVELGRLRRL